MKHLKKCNVAKRVQPQCHSLGINEGMIKGSPPEAHPPLTLADCPPERLEELIKRVEAAYEGKFSFLILKDLSSAFLMQPPV